MQKRFLSRVGRNRYTIALLVLVATLFLTGASGWDDGCGPACDFVNSVGCNAHPRGSGAITVTVKDSVTGNGIAGATITIDTVPPVSSETFSDGSFNYTYVPPRSYTLSATKAGYVPNGASVIVNVDDTLKPQIPLTPLGGTIAGTVTDAKTNATITGATVSLSSLGIPTTTAATDATGVYRFNNAPTGIALTLRATADKYDSKTLTLTPLGPADNKTAVDFALTQTVTATGSVTVTVLDATTGARVPATSITSISFGGVPLVARSSDSTYNLFPAAAGANVPLSVSATGFTNASRNLTLATGQSLSVTIPLSPVFPTTSAAPVCLSSAKSYRITLDWQRDAQGRPSDMDLLLAVPRAGTPSGCFLDYDISGNLCSSPNAQLRVENTHASGSPSMETVDISQLNPGTYQVIVNDYSGESSNGIKEPSTTLGDPKTAATVTVYGPKGTVSATAPAAPAGGSWYWIPFTIDGATGEVKAASPAYLNVGTVPAAKECPLP